MEGMLGELLGKMKGKLRTSNAKTGLKTLKQNFKNFKIGLKNTRKMDPRMPQKF